MHSGRRLVLVSLFAALGTGVFADGFYIPPNLHNITRDGVTIIWETEETSTGMVEYGPEGSLGNRAKEEAPAKIHRVRIAGLEPETVYSCRVRAATSAEALKDLVRELEEGGAYRVTSDEWVSTFKTAPATDRPIVFALVGDSRRWGKQWQETDMGVHVMQHAPEFILNMGDLVPTGHVYEQWPEHFERFAGVSDKIMMVTCRGNHEGSLKNDTENDWFGRYHDLPGDGEPFASFDWGNTHVVLISHEFITSCAEWLDEHLAKVNKKYKIVTFHYPIYCTGYMSYNDSRKDDGQGRAAAKIWQVLDKHNVSVHFAGHTHIYERAYPIRAGVRNDREGTTYITNGGGINAAYPDWWSALTDDPETMQQPTYTLVTCKDDRIENRTFCWSPRENRIVEIDYNVILRDETVPKAVFGTLPSLSGQELAQAIKELGAMLYAPASEALLEYLGAGHAPDTRRAAATALRAIGSEANAKALLGYVGDGDPHVGREAARALEIAMPAKLAKKVADCVLDNDADESVRESLIGALQLHAPEKVTQRTMTAVLESGALAKVRNRAAYALARVAGDEHVRTLVGLFEEEPERFAMLCLARALNDLTRQRIGLGDDQPLAQSEPGKRGEFAEQWLKGQ